MSLFCSYCSACPRHPCDSRKEASTCPNAERGAWHDFKPREVADWIRYQANGDEELEKAADLIEQKCY